MEAFKCDRCGKYYDVYTVSNGYFKDEVYVIFKESDNTRLDICCDCMHDLKNWFNDGRKPMVNPNKRIDISEGLDPKTGEWGHNS